MAYHLSDVKIIHQINQQDTSIISETSEIRNEDNSATNILVKFIEITSNNLKSYD